MAKVKEWRTIGKTYAEQWTMSGRKNGKKLKNEEFSRSTN